MNYFKIDCMPIPLCVVNDTAMTSIDYAWNRRFTICRAAREIFCATDDPVIKEKCRYISMMADAVTARLEKVDPGWLRNAYPRRVHFDEIMAAEAEAIEARDGMKP